MKRVDDWIRQAERSLDEAEFNFSYGYYELSCFLSQQSAELAIKGLLHNIGIERRGHSLLKLSENFDHY